jgi:hypothetical protein
VRVVWRESGRIRRERVVAEIRAGGGVAFEIGAGNIRSRDLRMVE